jgi:hypothetical protein
MAPESGATRPDAAQAPEPPDDGAPKERKPRNRRHGRPR